MRSRASMALLTASLLLAGFTAISSPATAVRGDDGQMSSHNSPTATEDGNTTLLTRSELFDSVVDVDESEATASLYFVADNGTWYHAYPNGTVGMQDPNGPEIPNIADETADLPSSDRPVYVWKVTLDSCGASFYDATSGETMATIPIPGCGGPTPPSETPSTEQGMETAATTPGFGVGVAILAFVVMALLSIRR